MKSDIVKLLSSASVGLGLFAIYLVFLNQFFAVENMSVMTTTESIILYTQLVRALILFVLGLKYQVQPIVPIIVFSFEALLIPPLLVLIILTGSPFYATFMGVLLTAWFGATALILTPYTIYGFSRSLVRSTSVSSVLVIASFELVSVLFLSSLFNGLTQPVQGLSGLGTLIISQIRSEISSGGVPTYTTDFLTSAGLVLFFIGTLFYMTLGNYPVGSKSLRLPWVVIVAFAGVILALFWIVAASRYQSDLLFVLTVPSVSLSIIIWGTTRGDR